MTGRIATNQAVATFIDQMFRNRLLIEKSRNEIASGLRVAEPSDDPGRSGSIATFQAALQRMDRHKQRIAFATNILEHQESTLDSANNVLTRAMELAEQGANGTYTPELREQIAAEVFQLRDQMVALANTTYQGLYIYGAADDDDQPFDAVQYLQAPLDPTQAADSRYFYDNEAGTQTTRSVEISDSESVRVVTPGDQVFANAIGALEQLGRALSGYETTLDVNGLPDGNGLAYTFPGDEPRQQAHILRALDALKSAAENNIAIERTSVGSRLARLDQVANTLDSLKLSTEASRASIQDADPIEAASKFQQLQTQLQALLASGAQIQQLSLLNYL